MDLVEQFLNNPNKDTFLQLRKQILSMPDYRPYHYYELTAYQLINQQKYAEALDYMADFMANYFLNPGFHLLAAKLLSTSDDHETAQREFMYAQMFLQGILLTGDGTEDHPYLVLHIADEYNVMDYLEKKTAGQALIDHGPKLMDRHDLEDGSTLWFDVTDMMRTHIAQLSDEE